MNTILNIPVDLDSSSKYTAQQLTEKLSMYAAMLVSPVYPTIEVAEPAIQPSKHTDWVKSMARYRVLDYVDDKQAMLDALDERYR